MSVSHFPKWRKSWRRRSVAYMFNREGRLFIERTEETDEDIIMLAALESGAEDADSTEDRFEIVTTY